MSHKRKGNNNVPCDLISNSENNELFRLLGQGCSTLSSGVVQLFLADSADKGEWNKRHCGIVCFVKDNEKKSYFIRIFDIQNKRMLWEQELYSQFRYNSPRQFFHTFEADNYRAGLNFASEDEADRFKTAVENKLDERRRRRYERSQKKAGSSTNRNVPNIAPPPLPSNAGNSAPVSNSDKSDERVIKKSTGNGKKSKGGYTKADIGTPSDFRHVSHVGWDPNKGFDMNNLNGDMKQLFQSVGIKPGDNIDKSTIEFIYDFVDRNGGIEAVKKEMARRPPPPPISAPPSMNRIPPPRPVTPTPPRSPASTPPPSRRKIPPPPVRSLPKPPAPPSPKSKPPTNFSPTSRAAPISPPHGGNKPIPPAPPTPPPAPVAPPAPTVTENTVGSSNNSRGDLLKAIAGGANLKKVTQTERPPPPEETGGLVGALQQELVKLREKMRQDEEVEEEDSFDDEEWD